MFPCEFWKIFKNIFPEEHLQMAASRWNFTENYQKLQWLQHRCFPVNLQKFLRTAFIRTLVAVMIITSLRWKDFMVLVLCFNNGFWNIRACWSTCFFISIRNYRTKNYISSLLEVFRKKVVLENFARFTKSTNARVSFLIKLQTWGLQFY